MNRIKNPQKNDKIEYKDDDGIIQKGRFSYKYEDTKAVIYKLKPSGQEEEIVIDISNDKQKITKLVSSEIKLIRRMFDNSLIIIDEVHNLNEKNKENEKGDFKLKSKYLKMIIRYAKNTKLLLLSATPIVDNVSIELKFLINLLLLNNNSAPIIELNNTNYEKILTEKTRGLISFVRGNDPLYFPKIIPLENDNDNEIECLNEKNLKLLDNINFKKSNNITLNKDLIKLIKKKEFPKDINKLINSKYIISNFIKCDITEHQIQYLDYINGNSLLKAKPSKASFKDNAIVLYLTLTPNLDIKKIMNDEDLKITTTNKIYSKVNKNDWLHQDNVEKYSTKFYKLLQFIKVSKGKIFIYTGQSQKIAEFVSELLTKNDYFDYSISKRKNKKNFVLFTGKTQQTIKKYREILNDEDNIDGKNIKIIIGNAIVSEGIDFKEIRQIHILMPDENLSKIEQAIGRGTRTNSHKRLPENEQNVTIFNYISWFSDNNKNNWENNIDLRRYLRSFAKKYQELLFLNVLKKNAVDCLVHRNKHYFKKQKTTLKNSFDQVVKDIVIGDESKSKCLDEINEELEVENYDFEDNLKIKHIENIKQIIINSFKELKKYNFTIPEFKEIIEKKIDKKLITDNDILLAINEILNIDFKNIKGLKGQLKETIFKNYTINSYKKNLPIQYKYYPYLNLKNNILIEKKKEKIKEISEIKDINEILFRLRMLIYSESQFYNYNIHKNKNAPHSFKKYMRITSENVGDGSECRNFYKYIINYPIYNSIKEELKEEIKLYQLELIISENNIYLEYLFNYLINKKLQSAVFSGDSFGKYYNELNKYEKNRIFAEIYLRTINKNYEKEIIGSENLEGKNYNFKNNINVSMFLYFCKKTYLLNNNNNNSGFDYISNNWNIDNFINCIKSLSDPLIRTTCDLEINIKNNLNKYQKQNFLYEEMDKNTQDKINEILQEKQHFNKILNLFMKKYEFKDKENNDYIKIFNFKKANEFKQNQDYNMTTLDFQNEIYDVYLKKKKLELCKYYDLNLLNQLINKKLEINKKFFENILIPKKKQAIDKK